MYNLHIYYHLWLLTIDFDLWQYPQDCKVGKVFMCTCLTNSKINHVFTVHACCKQDDVASHRISSIRRRDSYFSLLVFVWVLFEASGCLGKPVDVNDGWRRYVRAIKWRRLDAVSHAEYAQPLSLAVRRGNDSYNTNHPSAILVGNDTGVYSMKMKM